MDLKETDILGEAIGSHWYYQFKGNALLQLIANVKPARILDVGAGSGFFSRLLLERTPCMEAFCIDPSYEKEHVAMVGDKQIHYLRQMESLKVDLALFMDVIEHVDDDIALLQDYIKKVPPGTWFLLRYPLFLGFGVSMMNFSSIVDVTHLIPSSCLSKKRVYPFKRAAIFLLWYFLLLPY